MFLERTELLGRGGKPASTLNKKLARLGRSSFVSLSASLSLSLYLTSPTLQLFFCFALLFTNMPPRRAPVVQGPDPFTAAEVAHLGLLVCDTIESLPPSMTRCLSDLKELDAVLSGEFVYASHVIARVSFF
jgi:hypothetical protein